MNIFKKFNTILFKLTASYVLIIILSVLLTGGCANLYFKSYFNEQTTSANQRILYDLEEFINKDILEKIDALYLRLITETDTNQFFINAFSDPELDDYMIINQIKNYLLENQVLQSNWLNGIFAYFIQSETLVSTSGLLYKRGNRENLKPAWLEDMLAGKPGFAYIPTAPFDNVYESRKENVCLLVRKYPSYYADAIPNVLLFFEVKESVFRAILQQSADAQRGERIYLLDEYGNVISGSEAWTYPSNVAEEPAFAMLQQQETANGNFDADIGGSKNVVSYTTLSNYHWKLVSVTPWDLYYQASGRLQVTVVIICVLAILLGLLVSNFFAHRIYNPLKGIVEKISRTMGREGGQDGNEYATINRAISSMASQISDLTRTLDSNRPLIKQNMVNSLLFNKIGDTEELQQFLRITGARLSGECYVAVIVRLDRDMLQNLTVENASFLVYHMVEEIERMDGGATYLASGLEDDKLAVLSGRKTWDRHALARDIQYIIDYLFSNFYMTATAFVGEPCDAVRELHRSYASAQTALKYQMFLPKMSLVFASDILPREQSKKRLPSAMLTGFQTMLHAGKTEDAGWRLHDIVQELVTGEYSAAYCNTALMEVVSVVSAYLKELNIKSSDILDEDLLVSFNTMENIYAFETWMGQVMVRVADYQANREVNANTQIVEKAKQYIEDNLAGDLSLSNLSDQVYISTQYLSRLFKEETGMNLSDYVTNARMEKARELLLSTNLNVESIAERVGYNTPHYFIKKFKEKYGMTPKNYKMHHAP